MFHPQLILTISFVLILLSYTPGSNSLDVSPFDNGAAMREFASTYCNQVMGLGWHFDQ